MASLPIALPLARPVRSDSPKGAATGVALADGVANEMAALIPARDKPEPSPGALLAAQDPLDVFRCRHVPVRELTVAFPTQPASELSLGFHTSYRFFRLPSGQSTCWTV
jgi:hypothetical protein